MLFTAHLTTKKDVFIDITGAVRSYLAQSGVKSGILVVYSPHTTAGITINENVDPHVAHDMMLSLKYTCPGDLPQFKHAEGNSVAHVRASMIGASQTIIIENAKLLLGQ